MRFLTLNEDNVVIGIRNGKSLVMGEIQADVGYIGDKLMPNGEFVTPEPTQAEIELQAKNKRIKELKMIIPEKQMCGLDVTSEQMELAELLGY